MRVRRGRGQERKEESTVGENGVEKFWGRWVGKTVVSKRVEKSL